MRDCFPPPLPYQPTQHTTMHPDKPNARGNTGQSPSRKPCLTGAHESWAVRELHDNKKIHLTEKKKGYPSIGK